MHNPHPHNRPEDVKNLVVAFVICTVVLVLWQSFYAIPQQKKIAAEQQKIAAMQPKPEVKPSPTPGAAAPTKEDLAKVAEERKVAAAPKVSIRSDTVHGSISSLGLRFNDLTLTKYRTELAPDSAPVLMLNDSKEKNKEAIIHYASFGWISGSTAKVPDAETEWKIEGNKELTSKTPVTFTWANGEGLMFRTVISLDDKYMFKIARTVENKSGGDVKIYPYGLISHGWQAHKSMAILHEGPIGSFDGTLTEISHGDFEETARFKYQSNHGWLGVTEKYWFSAIIPAKGENFDTSFNYAAKDEENGTLQVDYLGNEIVLKAGEKKEVSESFFAGPKEIELLDTYAVSLDIPLFDRAVDLGHLYFLTKPIFLSLKYFNALLGNFGLAILLLTVFIKLALFPLSYKSYVSINAMKKLQPEIEKIKEKSGDDKLKMNKDLMDLYKREKVNPMAGCLPILIQIPIFFALYKVLYVSIEMRHAPFYGWIHDLSVADPTNLINLFGLIQWKPLELIHIGIWPLLMCITSVIQQKMNPKPTDPFQAQMVATMPYVFLVICASFPAGLVIYWTWSNFLSIIQQYAILKLHKYPEKKAAKKAARKGHAKAKA